MDSGLKVNIRLEIIKSLNVYFHLGDHLPTPPPIPPLIQRALEYLASLPSTESPDRRLWRLFHYVNLFCSPCPKCQRTNKNLFCSSWSLFYENFLIFSRYIFCARKWTFNFVSQMNKTFIFKLQIDFFHKF